MSNLSSRKGLPCPKGSLVLITGATGGLGKAFAVECASRGWDLFLTDLNQDALTNLSDCIRRTYGVAVTCQACNLTDPDARARLFDAFARQHLRFWFLINVAGVDFEGPFFEQTCQQILSIVRLNIEATLAMTHAILPYRDAASAFHILNVASLAAFSPMPVKATYAASKRFLLDFSLALREELRELGITVTALCPAGMPTNSDCVRAIDAQGLAGQITTQNIGSVADQALQAALAGKAVCVPGVMNRLIQIMSALLPTSLTVSLIGSRWKSAQRKRFQLVQESG